jgi:hypothetical protein
MNRLILKSLVFVTFLLSVGIPIQSAAAETTDQAGSNGSVYNLSPHPLLSEKNGIIVLDYETMPVLGYEPLDLLGYHYLNRVTDGIYVGIGGYAPLVQGDYGGFMAFDATLQAQKKIIQNLFVNVGFGAGGGGGGKSIEQSKAVSGDGGLLDAYVGLGYDFNSFAAGIRYLKFRLSNSAVDHSQLDFYVQVPVSYCIGPYGYSGHSLTPSEQTGLDELIHGSGENVLSFGLDNLVQLRPAGENHSTINLFDMQYSHYFPDHAYAFFDLGVGYHGIPLYNQVLGGVGYRLNVFPRVFLAGQVGLGSGGYAPSLIDTGPGLLVYPKLSAEYMFNENFGSSLSCGYLFAPDGSSKNMTVGASLNYHLSLDDRSSPDGEALNDIVFHGFRINMLQQTEVNIDLVGKNLHDLDMLSLQLDNVVGDYFYVPIQASVAYNDFYGYAGYGELLTGLGLQSKYTPKNRFQAFAQILLGANVLGTIAKLELGLNFSLNDHFALYGKVGHTASVDIGNQYDFSSNSFGLGLSYRFSVPSR